MGDFIRARPIVLRPAIGESDAVGPRLAIEPDAVTDAVVERVDDIFLVPEVASPRGQFPTPVGRRECQARAGQPVVVRRQIAEVHGLLEDRVVVTRVERNAHEVRIAERPLIGDRAVERELGRIWQLVARRLRPGCRAEGTELRVAVAEPRLQVQAGRRSP